MAHSNPIPVAATCAGEPSAAQPHETGRCLIPLAPRPESSQSIPSGRPSATFLAHLIATTQQAPQTRQRRRAEPKGACARYALARDPSPAPVPLRSM
jgi:hypothetical protein